MTILSLSDCCRQLGIDRKTLRRWLAQAQLTAAAHPADARRCGLSAEQLRLLAMAHHRSLSALAEELPAPAVSRPAEHPLPAELLAVLQTLSTLPAQLATLQQQLADLSECLHPPPAPVLGRPATLTRATAHPRPARASQPKRPAPPRHVLARVEYGKGGHYVVICPKRGLLPFEPESPAWFAWLASVSSFRFVGKCGRFTAHRESQRLPKAVWRAHRKIRNHTYNQRLSKTEGLTIAVLEQAAAALQAHLD
jgi:transposase-like protein